MCRHLISAALPAICLFLFSLSVEAKEWSCRNNELEITCNNGKCESQGAGGFTPMSVDFDSKGKLSVCAYSGCWEGTGKVLGDKDFIMVYAHKLKFSTSSSKQMGENVAIILDIHDNVAVIKVSSFAQPLTCSTP